VPPPQGVIPVPPPEGVIPVPPPQGVIPVPPPQGVIPVPPPQGVIPVPPPQGVIPAPPPPQGVIPVPPPQFPVPPPQGVIPVLPPIVIPFPPPQQGVIPLPGPYTPLQPGPYTPLQPGPYTPLQPGPYTPLQPGPTIVWTPLSPSLTGVPAIPFIPATQIPIPWHHNQHFKPECDPLRCKLNEDADFHSMSNEDEAIYELFYTNPIKCCLVIVEIGAGDGERFSFSKYFEDALKWKTLLIEANPDYYEELKKNRPNATLENGGFCESSHMEYYPKGQTFRMLGDSVEISSEQHSPAPSDDGDKKETPCLHMSEIFQKHSITKVDVMVIRVQGDALAFIRAMDWTVRVDIWIVLMHGQHVNRDLLTRDVLLRNEYVAAEWDIKRWCEALGACLNNQVFLRKGFNPLPCNDYLQPGGRSMTKSIGAQPKK